MGSAFPPGKDSIVGRVSFSEGTDRPELVPDMTITLLAESSELMSMTVVPKRPFRSNSTNRCINFVPSFGFKKYGLFSQLLAQPSRPPGLYAQLPNPT